MTVLTALSASTFEIQSLNGQIWLLKLNPEFSTIFLFLAKRAKQIIDLPTGKSTTREPFGPLMWQAEADTELTLSASPATAVGQILLIMAKFC